MVIIVSAGTSGRRAGAGVALAASAAIPSCSSFGEERRQAGKGIGNTVIADPGAQNAEGATHKRTRTRGSGNPTGRRRSSSTAATP